MRLTPIAQLANLCLAVFALVAALPAAFAAPLALDTTFGTAGKARVQLFRSSSDEEARAVVVQPDGKTVVAGQCLGPVYLSPSEICVTRFTGAGALDTTFGELGIFHVAAPVGDADVRAVTLDGTKIVVAGSCGIAGAQDFCVLRLNANGTLDTTFNTTGIAVTPVGALNDQANAVAMVGTKIVVAGECEVPGSTDMCLVRYANDGSLDATFGSGGKVVFVISNQTDGAYALTVIDGLVYAGGRCGSGGITFCVIRLTAAGALDATWANGGLLFAYVGTNQSRVKALAASGSNLLAAGECSNGTNIDFCLLRIDSQGQPDITLNGTGIVILPMGAGDDILTGLTRIGSSTLLSGTCDSGGIKVFCLVSLTEAGGISGSFNSGLPLLDPIGSTNAIAAGVSPGFTTLTVAGTCGAPFTLRDWCITRYDVFGQRDSSLGVSGLVVKDLKVQPGFDQPLSLLRQPDGKLLTAGACTDAITYTRCLARFNADGSVDTGFGTSGIVLLDIGGGATDAAISLDSSNRILVAGGCANAASACVTRLLANGSIDATYGAGGTAVISMGAGVQVFGLRGIVIDGTGAAVTGGLCNVPPFGLNRFCALKLTPAGALDAAFGTGGRTISVASNQENASSFIADAAGFLIAGDCNPLSGYEFCVRRLTAAGQFDTAFGGGTGRGLVTMGSTTSGGAVAALDAIGRIWLAGRCTVGGVTQFCVARMMPDGTIDTSFSGDGKANAPVNGLDDTALTLLPDGTGLLVAGTCQRPGPGTFYDFCVARFLADGTLDPAFNDSGVFTSLLGTGLNFGYGRALLRDGARVLALTEGDHFTLVALALLPNDVPRAPTAVVATPGDGQVSVAFTAPLDNGGNAILSYEATCGGQSNTGLATPIVVIGLSNGIAVTCIVTATNSAGTGPASAASASVTPRKVSTVSLSSSSNPSTSGNSIKLTASVTGQGPGGQVVFKNGGVTMPSGCGGATVIAGEAVCFISSLAVGTHNLIAEYSGDAANTPSTSTALVQTVIASGFTLTAGPAGGNTPGVGNGRVTSSPTGIDCGTSTSSCQASFSDGTQVALTATPDSGHRFGFWFGACSGSGACVVTMNANKTVSAAFAPVAPVPRALTISRSGSGTGTVASNPVGIACGATCTADFDDGTAVALTATPDAGSSFAGWTGSGCSGTGTCNVTMDAAKNMTATFLLVPPPTFALTVTKSGGGGGLITSTPAGVDCGATCSANFNSGVSVALGAAPSAGSFFNGWSGSGCSGTGACNATMDAAKSVGAEFKLSTTIPRLANIATRMQVLTGADVLIGGFIIGGSQAKTVVVRARGPSLTAAGVPGALGNPLLQLFSGQTVIASNDDWQQAGNAAIVQSSGFAPADTRESAIHATLTPGAYTAIVTGVGNTTGVGLIEVFEVDLPEVPLINIATRGQVLTAADVMIGGFIIQGDAPQTVIVRARGPSLTAAGVPGALQDPVLQLFSGQTQIGINDDWQADPNAGQVLSRGFAPADARESAILVTLPPGAYTAIVTGKNGTTGVGIIEVFAQ